MESKHPLAVAFKKVSEISPGFLGRALDAAKGVAPVFAAALAATAAPMIAGGVGNMLQRRNDAKGKAEAYREMLSMHAGLRKHDPVQVSRIYNSIHNANPMMARDPLVAGSIVENVINSNDIYQGDSTAGLLAVVKDLAGVRNSMSGAMRNESGLGASFASAASGMVNNFEKLYANVEKQHGQAAHLQKKLDFIAERSEEDAKAEKARAMQHTLNAAMAGNQAAARAVREAAEDMRAAGHYLGPKYHQHLRNKIEATATQAVQNAAGRSKQSEQLLGVIRSQ